MSDKKQPAEYVYTSTELGKFYGITIKGMEFYESKGLVHPQRVGQGKSRRFTLEDSYRLYMTRLFKNSGIGIPQTLELLGAKGLEEAESCLGSQLRRMSEDLRLQSMKLDALSHMRDMMLLATDNETLFEVIDHPGFYRLFLRHMQGPHESNSEETLEYRKWNDYLPISAASMRFPLADCREDAQTLDTRIGLIIEEQDFRTLGLRESSRTQHIPAGHFLHTIIHGDAQSLCSAEWIRPAVRFMKERGLQQCDDAFTRFFCLVKEDGAEVRYDEAWFPVL